MANRVVDGLLIPLFVGGHPAVDFCNTRAGWPTADEPPWREYLQGRVAWATQLNPTKAIRLKRLLDQVDWSR